MKKKLIALVLILVVALTLMAGCDMFVKDESRDFHQVVAKVDYEGMSAEVYKGDLLSYVANYGASYMQNYGMSAEQVTEYFYSSLSKQKLLTLYAREYAALNLLGKSAADLKTMGLEDYLTVDERRFCVEQANKQFEDSWQSYIKELKDEADKNKGEAEDDEDADDETKDDELAARPGRDTEEEEAEYKDEGLTDASKLPADFYTDANAKIKAEQDNDARNRMRSALKSLDKDLAAGYKDYDYYLNAQYESRILAKYQDAVGDSVKISDDEVAKRLTKLTNTDIQNYIDDEAFSKAVTGGTFTYYNRTLGFGKVNSILLKFSDKQTAALTNIGKLLGDDEDSLNAYRKLIALGGTADENDPFANLCELGLKVNVSNPDYDEDEDELADAYTDLGVDYKVVLYAMADYIADKAAKTEAAAKASGITDETELKLIREYALSEAFTDWLYLVNDDEGMFKGTPYYVTPKGTASSYVKEYTVLARRLVEQTVGDTVYATDETQDSEFDGALAYAPAEGKDPTALLAAANGKTGRITSVKAESTLEDDEKIETEVYTLTTEDGNAISFIVNEFGIHIVMNTGKIADEEYGTVEKAFDKDGNDIGWTLGGDYIYSSEVTVEYVKDADGKDTEEIAEVSIEITRLNDYINDTIKNERVSDTSTTSQTELFKKDYIKKNDKVFKNVGKQVSKMFA